MNAPSALRASVAGQTLIKFDLFTVLNERRMLPTEILHEILSHVPQGRHVLRGVRLKKHAVIEWLEETVLGTKSNRPEVSRNCFRILRWFVDNNAPPVDIAIATVRAVESNGSKRLYPVFKHNPTYTPHFNCHTGRNRRFTPRLVAW